ncbi:equilibrative nucleoside transporter 1-like isoform X2 [Apostichopus japonicus]
MGSSEVTWNPKGGAEIEFSVNGGSANHSHENGHSLPSIGTPSRRQNGYTTLPQEDISDGTVQENGSKHNHLTKTPKGYTSMEDIQLTNNSHQNGGTKEKLEKGVDEGDTGPPIDKWMLAFIIFALHGVGTLLPWNCFITAEAYFTEHKFGNLSDDVQYKDKFIAYLGLCGFLPNLTFLAIALFFPPKSNRVMTFLGLIVMMLLFVLTTILAVVDTSDWPGAFFAITMATIVIFNGAGAIYQSGMFALAAKLPGTYMQSYIVGQGLGGTFVAVLGILSLAAAGDLQKAAVGYFLCAVFVLILAVITFVFLFYLPIVKYYIRLSESFMVDSITQTHSYRPPPLWQIFKEIKLQILNIWLTFAVSLTIFPAMQVDVVATHNSSSVLWGLYFTPVTCFLLFNLLDFLGSIVPAWIKWPSRRRTWILVVSRIVLIPLVMFCNYRPETRSLPVLIHNDYIYILIVSLMSLSNGYLKTTIMIDAPKHLSNPEWASKAAAMMVLFLVLGIFTGLQFSIVVSHVV